MPNTNRCVRRNYIKGTMKLVIDSKIPFIRGFAEQLGETVYLSGADITAADVRDADALIIRTRTHCNEALLAGSAVRFVATATIGYDHIDTDFMHHAHIAWSNCPGCNATSVAQYVEAACLLLAAHGCWSETQCPTPLTAPVDIRRPERNVFAGLTLGIVGVGHVGKSVAKRAAAMGFEQILLCDPPRAEREGQATFTPFDELARRCDIITFHTPLTHAPQPHATYHMASEAWFDSLQRCPVIINTSRGEAIDTEALKRAIDSGRVRTAVIDTWENEPHIDRELLQKVFIGTPHIAGYSADGKANGTRMALQAVARHFDLSTDAFESVVPPPLPEGFAYYPEGQGRLLAEELRLYDPTRDAEALRTHPECFEKLRGDYPLRREMP